MSLASSLSSVVVVVEQVGRSRPRGARNRHLRPVDSLQGRRHAEMRPTVNSSKPPKWNAILHIQGSAEAKRKWRLRSNLARTESLRFWAADRKFSLSWTSRVRTPGWPGPHSFPRPSQQTTTTRTTVRRPRANALVSEIDNSSRRDRREIDNLLVSCIA